MAVATKKAHPAGVKGAVVPCATRLSGMYTRNPAAPSGAAGTGNSEVIGRDCTIQHRSPTMAHSTS